MKILLIALVVIGFWATNKHIKRIGDKIMASQEELTTQVQALSAQALKIDGEILAARTELTAATQRIADLEALIAAGGPVTPELQAAVDELKSNLQRVDDELPDAPANPPTP